VRRRRSWHHARAGVSLKISVLLVGCAASEPPPLCDAPEVRSSYAIGHHLGERLRAMRARLDPDQIVEGFAQGLAGQGVNTAGLDQVQIAAELGKLAVAGDDPARAQLDDEANRARQAGRAFLAQNRTQPDVVELPSGLQYRVAEEGGAPPPSITDRITVDYEGRLLDGAVFDTSKDRFAPTILRLARAPRAWREVLPLVAGGSTVEVWVPGDLEPAEHPVGLVPPGELVAFTLRVAAIDRIPNRDVARAPP
jgi:FKBP-type peptidyl-prolyl cis-trans isomerase